MNFRLIFNMVKAYLLSPIWYYRHRHFKCDAGYECDWVFPYGFVPEDGCPIHDNDVKLFSNKPHHDIDMDWRNNKYVVDLRQILHNNLETTQ